MELKKPESIDISRRNKDLQSTLHRIYKKQLNSDPPPREKIPRPKKELRCEKCRERFDRLVDLRLHERKGICRMFRCQYCPKEFDSEIRLRAHLKYFHQFQQIILEGIPPNSMLRGEFDKTNLPIFYDLIHMLLKHSKNSQ